MRSVHMDEKQIMRATRRSQGEQTDPLCRDSAGLVYPETMHIEGRRTWPTTPTHSELIGRQLIPKRCPSQVCGLCMFDTKACAGKAVQAASIAPMRL